MFVPRFSYHLPDSLGEALSLLAEHGSSIMPLAGGTDMMILLKEGRINPGQVMSLRRLDELQVCTHGEGRSTLGANLAIGRLQDSPLTRGNPAFGDFLRQMGTLQVRNRATLGGNLVSAATCADAPPVLMVSDGLIHLQSKQSSRQVSPKDFHTGERQTLLGEDELVVSVSLSNALPGSAYVKFGQRNAGNIAVVGVAASLELEDGLIKDLKLAGTAVAPIPVDGNEVAREAIGKAPVEDTWQMLADGFDGIINPRSNLRASAEYRRHLARLGVVEALKLSLKRLQGGTP